MIREVLRRVLLGATGPAVAAALPDEQMAQPPFVLDGGEYHLGGVSADDGWCFNYGHPIKKTFEPGSRAVAYTAGEPYFKATFCGQVYCFAMLKEVGYFIVPEDHASDDVIVAGINDYVAAAKGGSWATPNLRGLASFVRACRRTYLGLDAGKGLVPQPFPEFLRLAADPFGKLILFDPLPDSDVLEGNRHQRRCGQWLRDEGYFKVHGPVTIEELAHQFEDKFKDLFGKPA